MVSAASDLTLDDAWEHARTGAAAGWTKASSIAQSGWSRTTKRMRIASAVVLFCILSISLIPRSIPENALPPIPKITLDYGGPAASPYNISKVALLIENRPNPILAPLMLHFMTVVPPDWRFRFMGSEASVNLVNSSRAVRDQVTAGKLDLTYIPSNMTTGSQEEISRFLTNLWLYETVLQPAEWLLVFQTDSVLCANSRQSLNNYLEYDWVGAPWNPEGRFGGNGGLSLRRVSKIVDVLKNQERLPDSEPEDVWLTDRLGHRPGAKLANGTVSLIFSGEMFSGKEVQVGGKKKTDPLKAGDLVKGMDDWRDGFYEPMGYHTGGSGSTLHSGIWGTPEMRQHIWRYCPEVKMTLKMDAAKYVPGNCKTNWKRSMDTMGVGEDTEMETQPETEIIDGVEYPMLPAGIVPW